MKELLIAVVSLVVGAIIGPYINWGIEKKKQKLAYRKELITKWRKMLQEAASHGIDRDDNKLLAVLERHEDFFSLSGHIGSDYQEYRKRHASVDTPVFLRYLAEEVSRIEKEEWDLV